MRVDRYWAACILVNNTAKAVQCSHRNRPAVLCAVARESKATRRCECVNESRATGFPNRGIVRTLDDQIRDSRLTGQVDSSLHRRYTRVTLASGALRFAWNLRSKKYVKQEDNGDLALTCLGVDHIEQNRSSFQPLNKRLQLMS
jgi:hypothetical protein